MIAALTLLLAPVGTPLPTSWTPELGAAATYAQTRRYTDSEDGTVTEWKDNVKVMVQQRESSGVSTLLFEGKSTDSESTPWKYTLSLGKMAEFKSRSEDSEDAVLAARMSMATTLILPEKPVLPGQDWAWTQRPNIPGEATWVMKYKFLDESVVEKRHLCRIQVQFTERGKYGMQGEGEFRWCRETQLIHDGKWTFARAFLPSDELAVPQALVFTWEHRPVK